MACPAQRDVGLISTSSGSNRDRGRNRYRGRFRADPDPEAAWLSLSRQYSEIPLRQITPLFPRSIAWSVGTPDTCINLTGGRLNSTESPQYGQVAPNSPTSSLHMMRPGAEAQKRTA